MKGGMWLPVARLIENAIIHIRVRHGLPERLALSASGVESERGCGAHGGAIGHGQAVRASQCPRGRAICDGRRARASVGCAGKSRLGHVPLGPGEEAWDGQVARRRSRRSSSP